jgi:pimeloyl-ACP methyl ester carboxylesterase
VAALLLAPALAGCDPSAFYEEPVPELDAAELGEVLRFEPIKGVSAGTLSFKAGETVRHGARVYRILYRTQGLDGGADVASARLAIPDLDAPPEGFVVVAHLHGTLGMADRCAPSRDRGFGFESSSNPHAARMLAEGRVVVEPDYLGLGPPGLHPYLAARPVATSVLDGIRAAGRFADPDRDIQLSPPPFVALEGHSQGGHAVLATLAWAADYAPELDIRAAVAMAPPGAPTDMLASFAGMDHYGGFLGMALLGLLAAHPDAGEPEDWLTAEVAADLPEKVEDKCPGALSRYIDASAAELLLPAALDAIAAGDAAGAGIEGLLDGEDLGETVTATPLLVVHGTDDSLLPIELTEAYVDRLIAVGDDVTFLPVEGSDHLFVPWNAREDIWAFLEERLEP